MPLTEAAYRLAIALLAGGNAIFTLLVTPLLFQTESRDTAARIVGHLFPFYFRWILVLAALALAFRVVAFGLSRRLPVVVLTLILLTASVQTFWIEPRGAELKAQIRSFETVPKEHPLRREFSRLHHISAAGNLGTLAGSLLLIVVP
jgi:hypothetical protein